VRAGPLVLVKKALGNDASDIVGSFSEATMRRGARDRRGLRGEGHRREQGHRAKRCGYAQILASGTSIAKEHLGTGVGETEGKRLADAMIKAKMRLPWGEGVTRSAAPGSAGRRQPPLSSTMLPPP